ncbi:N-lysine methyltransferase KMT5A-A [Halichoeres trimaculatus]|uniref:N-lysine methyltransferase KMT5A-A n=1 Tax=Halichoeres trimaculatus TaxID=147232 RepID=UPI003D9F8D79
MNGEIVCTNQSFPVLNCNKSVPPVHDENTIKLTQEERCSTICCQQTDAQRQGEGWRTNTNTISPKDAQTDFSAVEGKCSPCWPAPTDHHSLSPHPLHNNNSSPLHSHPRRVVRRKVKGKKALKIPGGKNSQNRKLTDFYPTRRSSRKSKTELKCEEKKHLDELITKGIEEGMRVQHIEGKGRGVFATQCFQKGDYVVEYHGDLLQINDAKKREAEYAQNPATGCYMYYFQYLCKTYCVDATRETDRMGRLINHSKTGNCQTKLHDINGVPHLILVASRNIEEGEELLYDYGDRSKASIAAHPWLKY